jgi:tRNA/rRNA methyltransferase
MMLRHPSVCFWLFAAVTIHTARSVATPSPSFDGPAPKCGPKVSRPITPTKSAAYAAAKERGFSVPSVLLCRPFDDGNVGAAARAMLNFGLWDLRLAQPDADPRSDEALLRASGARPILERAPVHQSLGEAVEDLQLVLATTARTRERSIPVYSPRDAMLLAAKAVGRGERVGFLFGSEKNGLSNEELEHATAIVTIPTNPGFSSLNLAQAVLLVCYEWVCASAGANDSDRDGASAAAPEEQPSTAPSSLEQRAPLGQLDSLFGAWEESLWSSGFFGGDRGVKSEYGEHSGHKQEQARAASAMARLRRLVLRGEPSRAEASLLRGALESMSAKLKRPREG